MSGWEDLSDDELRARLEAQRRATLGPGVADVLVRERDTEQGAAAINELLED